MVFTLNIFVATRATFYDTYFSLKHIWSRKEFFKLFISVSYIYYVAFLCWYFRLVNVYFHMHALFSNLWPTLNKDGWTSPKYCQNVSGFDLQKIGSFTKYDCYSREQMKLYFASKWPYSFKFFLLIVRMDHRQ